MKKTVEKRTVAFRLKKLKGDIKNLPLFDKIFDAVTIALMITALILRPILKPESNMIFQIGLNVAALFSLFLTHIFFSEKSLLGGLSLKAQKLINIVVLFGSFGGQFLSMNDYYENYDTFTHLVTGSVGCFIGYYVFIFLTKKEKVENIGLCVAFCLFTSLSFALLWEIFEFTSDFFFGSFCQGYNLISDDNVNDKFFFFVKWFPFASQRVEQRPLYDTFADVYAALISSVITCCALKKSIKKDAEEKETSTVS